ESNASSDPDYPDGHSISDWIDLGRPCQLRRPDLSPRLSIAAALYRLCGRYGETAFRLASRALRRKSVRLFSIVIGQIMESFELQLAFFVLDQELNLFFHFIELVIAELHQADALFESRQRIVERQIAGLELFDDRFQLLQSGLKFFCVDSF